MINFITRNWRLKLLALVLAIIAWVGVVYAANPPGVKAVPVPVPQPPTVSLPAGYVLTQPIPELTVNVAGTADSLSNFSANQIQVTVNYGVISSLGNNVPATVSLPIQLVKQNPNVQLDNPPTTVQASVDKIGTAVRGVTVAVGTNPQAGYTITEEHTTPATVTLTGPEHELGDAQVKTQSVDLGYQTANFTETLKVYAYAQSQVLSNVNVSPASVTATITLTSPTTTRTSGVVLGSLRGLPSGYGVSSVTYSPLTVTLTGTEALINGASLNTVSTAPIELGAFIGTRNYTVSIPSPGSGISVSPASVTVTVTTYAIPTPTPAPTPRPTPTPSPSPSPSPS
ncbi:MAG: CdaR family protein [Candidatus Dormiibacterota bacterium]